MPTTQSGPEWFRHYDDPGSEVAQRLPVVREQIRVAVESAPPGPIRVVSLCSGDGRDLIGALANHPRRDDVRGRLIELGPVIAGWGRSPEHTYGVGVHRLAVEPRPLPRAVRLFTFFR